MSKRTSPRLVGAFVLAATALGVAGAVWLGSARVFQRKVRFVVVFAQDLAGLEVDAPVKFRGVRVGRVGSIHLSIGSPKEPLRELFMPVVIELNQSRIREMGERTDLGDPAVVHTLVENGLRARLALESFLSGRRYVDLDIVPGAPQAAPPPIPFPYPVIPVYVEPGLQALQADTSRVLAKILALDLEGLIADLRKAAAGIGAAAGNVGKAAASFDRAGDALPATLERMDHALAAIRDAARTLETSLPGVAADARQALQRLSGALESLDASIRSVRATIEPGAPVPARLEEALREISAAARSIRQLADAVERNPGQLIRGRAEGTP